VRRRFFVDAFDADRAVLTGEAAHHLGRVLRAEPGQLYELSDGTSVRLGKIEFSDRDRVEFSLLEPIPVRTSSVNKTLLLAVVKFDAFEWAIEKATELGVDRIVPLAAARSEKGLLVAAGKRAERWKKIVFEASQQSRRVRLPAIENVAQATAAFRAEGTALRVMLSERNEVPSLRQVLQGQAAARASAMDVALAIGPEGGWTDAEFEAAGKAGFREASLGNLILRTETAVIACLAAVNYALGA
jgi:16S rRNA (uracil1498-N3)-methyltransferase